jgi:pilus assembly protein Flp/PilA
VALRGTDTQGDRLTRPGHSVAAPEEIKMPITRLRGKPIRRPSGGIDEGATAVEYALLIVLIIVTVISAITLLGGNVDAVFGDLADQLGGGDSMA